MASAYIEIEFNEREIRAVMADFQRVSFIYQKRHVAEAIKRTIKPRLPSLRRQTPYNRGGLQKSASYVVDKPKKKGDANKNGMVVYGRVGFLRGEDERKKTKKKGYAAHLVNSGVKRQYSVLASGFRLKPMMIEWPRNRKYQYLGALRRRGSNFIPLYEKRAVAGTGFFDKWWNANSSKVRRSLQKNLGRGLRRAFAKK